VFYDVFVLVQSNGEIFFEARDLGNQEVRARAYIPDEGEFPKMPRGLNGIQEGETPLAAIESMRQHLIDVKSLARRQSAVI
jgi:hypothetical protein